MIETINNLYNLVFSRKCSFIINNCWLCDRNNKIFPKVYDS